MKEFIVASVLVVLGLFIANLAVGPDANSMKSHVQTTHTNYMTRMNTLTTY